MKLLSIVLVGFLLVSCSTTNNMYNLCGNDYTDYDVVKVERYKQATNTIVKYYVICRKNGKSKIVSADDMTNKGKVKE